MLFANNSSSPLVSVVMPVYNQEEFVIESIKSVLSQDYDNIELLICDDSSTDNTASLIAEFVKNAPLQGKKIEFYVNDNNKGVTENVNELIRKSSGVYVSFFSGDDVMHKNKISTQVDYMEKNKCCTICYHDVVVFRGDYGDEESKLYMYSARHGTKSGSYKALVKYGSFNCGCSNLVRMEKKVYARSSVRNASDWLHYIEILLENEGEIHYINEVLAGYRRHSDNITSTSSQAMYDEILSIVDALRCVCPDDDDLINAVYAERSMTYGFRLLLEKHPVKGVTLFVRGFLKRPFSFIDFIYNLKRYVEVRIG